METGVVVAVEYVWSMSRECPSNYTKRERVFKILIKAFLGQTVSTEGTSVREDCRREEIQRTEGRSHGLGTEWKKRFFNKADSSVREMNTKG